MFFEGCQSLQQQRQQESRMKKTALQKMQEISERLISNTPELAKMLDTDSPLKNGDKKGAKKEVFPKEMTINDYLERNKDLSARLDATNAEVANLREELEVYKKRSVEREIEYRKIIEELQNELKSKLALDGGEKVRMQVITDLHGKIQDNIVAIQARTSKILVQQESDIIKFFHKKINEIKEKFRQEKLSKGEKDQEFLQKEKQLVTELDWIKDIAQKIDHENQTLLKKYHDLKSQFDIQQNDRELIVKELILKKKKNAILTTQVEEYQKALQDLTNEPKEEENRESVISNHQEEPLDESRARNVINTLKQTLAKEQRKAKEFKTLYVEHIQNKAELEKILRQIVDDIKDETIQLKIQGKRKREEQGLSKEARDKVLERLMNHQKILNLIYDKTFYPDNRKIGDLDLKDLSLQ